MRQFQFLKPAKAIAVAVATALALSSVPLPASAGMIPTERTVAVSEQRDQLRQFLTRDDVRAQLEALGVDPVVAQKRVDALSDAEIAQLPADLRSMPAGGVDVLAIVVGVALILLLTDLLGVTRVYPFVHR